MGFGKILLVIAIFASLFASVVFSMKSFTGYLISDQANNQANLISLIFFVIGLLGTWLFLAKIKKST